ncbi:MAG: AraC family transcriptional regulator [Bradyrhizobium sp.]|nr:AraC family transcriptional regulator [Bradyrhizobium sp.]
MPPDTRIEHHPVKFGGGEWIGVGPVTFLQRKRLCDIHSALRDCDPASTTIAEIALQHGFLNLGRFSGYYRALFDEYPSETFRKSYPPSSLRFVKMKVGIDKTRQVVARPRRT